MVTITATEQMRELLDTLSERAEVRDAEGRVLGYFTPAEAAESELYRRARSHFDPDEIRRRKESNEPTYSTAEVLEHLRSLESP